MKKILLMAVVMLASVASYAQQAVGTFTLQPKIGMNVASLTKSDGADPRIGLAAGVEAEYQATDIFSISAGVIYLCRVTSMRRRASLLLRSSTTSTFLSSLTFT